jgi:hypothetical protein
MPILAQPNPHPKRRCPWLWGLLGGPGIVFLLVTGVMAWSWNHHIAFQVGRILVLVERSERSSPISGPNMLVTNHYSRGPLGWDHTISLPDGSSYFLLIDWR